MRGVKRLFQTRATRVAVVVLVLVAAVVAAAVAGPHSAGLTRTGEATPSFQRAGASVTKPPAGVARKDTLQKRVVLSKPNVLHLKKARSAVFDVRRLKSRVVRRERPEVGSPEDVREGAEAAGAPTAVQSAIARPAKSDAALSPAPAPSANFDGLDFANWGSGHPPDTNGDVGPTYYIQTVNSSVGTYDKSTGTRVAAFTFNALMSQGHFGNLCDTDNFGDPVVLYDTFEDRWFLTDFAFKLNGAGQVVAPAYQCFAVSQTSDPVAGGWNFYSVLSPDALNDYPKFGVWPDGIYMAANMFGFGATGSYVSPHVWAINKQQMYAGAPTVQVIDFPAPSDDFTLLPANARLQTGTPPAGTPEYFVSTWPYLNGVTVYKLRADWDKISTSTFTGPELQLAPTCWPNATVPSIPTPGNSLDALEIRAMAQAQYSNLGGAESLWVSHTVRRGESATNTNCNAPTTGAAAVRWYQLNVSGGTVAANAVQGKTWDPDGSDVFHRWMPSVAVDRAGDMAVGYSLANATTNPKIVYAGRLAGDPANTFGQGEQTLIAGTGAQTGNCGSSACERWGDYSGMALDPNGCELWETAEYYAVNGLDHHTRIGSFHFPGCAPVGNGTLSGTVTDGTNPVAGAAVTLGTRTATTDGSGSYSFFVPAGTYPSLTVSKDGFTPGSAASIAVPNGGTATRNFTLAAADQSGCFTDNTQTAFQRGIPASCDLTSSPGNVRLASPNALDQENSDVTTSGFGFSNTSWAGQTFTPAVTGQLVRADVELFCSSCGGANPDIMVSVRATSGGVPTGSDLAVATLPGFDDGGAGGLKSVTFSSPATVTAGARYALIFRATAARVTGTYAYTCSCSSPNSNPYANGQRVTSTTSGSTWTADNTSGGRDLDFRTYVNSGFAAAGTFVSSLKDANPAVGRMPTWTTLSWTATTPAGTAVKFQVAGSNNANGPFSFVGPDGTAGTYFTTTGASLSQFNGFRYLRYEAFLSTSNSSATPSLSSVGVCFNDVGGTTATSVAVSPATGTYGGTTSLTATLTGGGSGVSGKTIAFTLNGSSVGTATTNGSGVATLAGVSLAGINAGSYPAGVGASFAGDATYGASSGSGSLTVAKANQTITVTTHAPSTAAYGSTFFVAATASSGLGVSFSSAGSCSNAGNAFTITSGSGTCTVKYDQPGSGNYNAAPQVTESVTAQKANQTITVTTHAPASAAYNTSFDVAATAAPGLAVSYSSAGACSNSAAHFTMTSGTGTCTVKYDQPGNGNYNAAPQVTESVTAQKANQTITVSVHAPASAGYNSSFNVSAAASSSLLVSYSSAGSCSNIGATFTITSATGTCTVKYDQAGDANYNAAPQLTESVAAAAAAQAINVTTHAPLNAVYGSSFSVAATGGGSGNPVTFSSSGACSNVGATFTMTSGTGTCAVKYDQAGDSNYDAAPQVTETVSAQKANQTISVTKHAPATATYNAGFDVAATSDSGLAISYSSAGACSNTGATFTMTSGTGTCAVKYDQAGDANFSAAAQVSESVTAQKANQTIAVTTHAPANAAYNSAFDVASATGNGLPITYSSAGVCSNVGATFTMTSGTGTCTVKYDQPGNGNYNAAPQVTESVTAQKANQAITITIHAPSEAVSGSTFTVGATASSTLTVSFSSAGVCSYDGTKFTMTSGTGTCTVKYDQAGDANYKAATQLTESVTAKSAGQAIAVTTHAPASAVYGSSFTVAASGGGSGNPVTFSSAGACSNVGPTFTVTNGTGSCTVAYDQAGDADYAAAPRVTETVTTQKAPLLIAPSPASATRQYSDPNPAIAASISGFVSGDDQSALSAQPACSSPAGATSAPASYPIACGGGAAANYTFSYGGGTLNVVGEDARASYSGSTSFRTRSASSATASALLSATIRDVTAVGGDPAFDPFAGDIRNAKVTFVNRATGAAFAGCWNLPVTLAVPTDATAGSASCTTTLAAPRAGLTRYTVGIVVSGYYARDSSTDNRTITVTRAAKKAPPKKVTLCYRHHTVRVTRAKAKTLRKRGAKLGACKRHRSKR